MRRIRPTLLAFGISAVLTACHGSHVCVPTEGSSETAPRRGLWVSTHQQRCLIGHGSVEVSVDSGGEPTGSGNIFSAVISGRRYRNSSILDMVHTQWADSATLIVRYSAGLDVRRRVTTMPGFRVVFATMW